MSFSTRRDWHHQIGTALDWSLIAVAVAFLVVPELRSPATKAAVTALFFAHSALGIYGYWRSGLLTKSLPQIHEQLKTAGAPKRRPAETAAMFIGLIALGFVFWA